MTALGTPVGADSAGFLKAAARVVAPWILLLGSFAAVAHKPSDSYLTLKPAQNLIDVRWDIALRDLDAELGLDVNDDGVLTWGEIRQRQRDLDAFVLPRLTVRSNGVACSVATSEPPVPSTALAIDSHSDGAYAVFTFRLACPSPARSLEIEYRLFATSDPTHRGILRLIEPGSETSRSAVLDPGAVPRSFSLTAANPIDTVREFAIEGIWHIWMGFDHILFLLALLLTSVLLPVVGTNQRVAWQGVPRLSTAALDMLKIVTAFTLAHSITLALAVLDLVTLPSRLVESVIALTVLLAALNNLRPVLHGRRWVATFFFGLIHGFGFAGALKDLGLPADTLGWSLFGFNAGVEIGQLAIVAVFFPLAFGFRHSGLYRRGVLMAGSALVALVALVWFIERAFDLKFFPT